MPAPRTPAKPPWNLPTPSFPYLRWLEAWIKKIAKRADDAYKLAEAALRAASGAAGGLTRVSGGALPEGQYRGAVVTSDVDGNPVWSTPMGSIVPKYYLYLDPNGSGYDLNYFGPWTNDVDVKKMLPEPLFEYNTPAPDTTYMDWPLSWGNELAEPGSPLMSDAMPIQMEVYLYPDADGHTFSISLPSSYVGSGGAPWFTVIVYNDSGFTANIDLAADTLTYVGGVQRPPTATIAPGEYLAWKVDTQYFDSVGLVQPFWVQRNIGTFGSPINVNMPLDNYYWKNVRALERTHSFTAKGNAAVATGWHRFYNSGTTTLRIGKIAASVGTAPSGSPLQVQAKLNGVTAILSSPLSIAAGANYAAAVPDAGGVSPSGWALPAGETLVLLKPGEYLDFDVTAIGSPTPGADLGIQVLYG